MRFEDAQPSQWSRSDLGEHRENLDDQIPSLPCSFHFENSPLGEKRGLGENVESWTVVDPPSLAQGASDKSVSQRLLSKKERMQKQTSKEPPFRLL